MARKRLPYTAEQVAALPSLEDAQAIGARHYNGGTCQLGHTWWWTTRTKQCGECVRIRANKYYANNRNQKLAYAREYSKKNYVPKPPRTKPEISWEKRNPERRREIARKSYAKNKDTHKAKSQRYRVQKLGAPGTGVTKDDINEIRNAQGGKCAMCRSSKRLELDHIMPLARGGEHSRKNMQFLCKSCNSEKNARDPVDFARRKGFLL